jgi:hypothetical protein
MKLTEFTHRIPLNEVAVISSWIEDLEFEDGDVIMSLNSGRQYMVHDVPDYVYEEWVQESSKGKFWWSDIRGLYLVSRL